MKKGFNILMIMCAVLAVLSCSKSRKSYTDMLKDQRKAIDKLIDQENIQVLNSYPADSVFGPNQFVKLDNGVYLNVIDPGDKTRAVMYKTNVLTRFSFRYFMGDTTSFSIYGPHSNGYAPVEFKYGYYTGILGAGASTLDESLAELVSEGFQTPLQYVGDRAKVKIIVPFQIGSANDLSSGNPIYYDIVEYKFE